MAAACHGCGRCLVKRTEDCDERWVEPAAVTVLCSAAAHHLQEHASLSGAKSKRRWRWGETESLKRLITQR